MRKESGLNGLEHINPGKNHHRVPGVTTVKPMIIRRKRYLGRSSMIVSEVKDLIQLYRPGHHYRMIWVFMLTVGMRGGETVGQKKSRVPRLKLPVGLTTPMFSENWHVVEYPILKPAIIRRDEQGRVVFTEYVEKIRRVVLPEYTWGELMIYLAALEQKGLLWRDNHGGWHTRYPHDKLFPVNDTMVLDAEFADIRKALGGRWLEKEFEYDDNSKRAVKYMYRCRPHKLRHFWMTVRYYQKGMDLVAVQREVGHSKVQQSFSYAHSADEVESSREILERTPWEKLIGPGACEKPLWMFA